MKSKFYFVFTFLFVLLLSCDKYEEPRPSAVEVSFHKAGIIEFKMRQWSDGKYPKLQTDTMRLHFINQSNSKLKNVRYSIRGFEGSIKEYQSFNYWQEETFNQEIHPFEEDSMQLSKSFSNLISNENIEVDLMSYMFGNEEIKHNYSGSYSGTFTVLKDSSFLSYGEHYSWIDYRGFLTSYYDKQKFPWRSITGQIVSDTILYGELLHNDTIINITSSVADSLDKIYINYGFKIDSIHNYHLSMTLNKNQ